jgi:hypothetical protein
MSRPKRAPSRIASQLQALQNVGKISKAIRAEKKPKREKPVPPPAAPPPSAPPPAPPPRRAVDVPPSLAVQVQAPKPKQPQDGDIVTDSTGQKWLHHHRLIDGQLRLTREPVGSPPESKPEAPKPKSAETQKYDTPNPRPWAGINASGTPVLVRQPTRTELAERHRQLQGGPIPERHSDIWFINACAARNRVL